MSTDVKDLSRKLNKLSTTLAAEAQGSISGGLRLFESLPAAREILPIVRANAWAAGVALDVLTKKIDLDIFLQQLKTCLGEAKKIDGVQS